MSTTIKVEEMEFNNTEILDDEAIQQIGQEVNQLIELLDDEDEDDNHTVERYPGLVPKSTKRDHENNGKFYLIIIIFIEHLQIKF